MMKKDVILSLIIGAIYTMLIWVGILESSEFIDALTLKLNKPLAILIQGGIFTILLMALKYLFNYRKRK